MIADFRLAFKAFVEIGNRKLAIGNELRWQAETEQRYEARFIGAFVGKFAARQSGHGWRSIAA
ncbi:MAG: hypothetical protein AUJ04_10430 [Acidobacteria bacterium 13_1_40CM_3_55_6]|nr:MAG: hypothetical protein AUJ04_10430 [Acidobacteria bacterium 13_1_40CM_3_55_6]